VQSQLIQHRSLVCRAIVLSAAIGCSSDQVTAPPAPTGSIVVTPSRLVLGVGMSRQVTATVRDESGAPVAGATVSFVSSDSGRVRVTPDGVASYAGPGEAEIRVSSQDLEAAMPYTGLGSGHPARLVTTSTRLPGDREGDAPFGVAVDGQGRILISQADSGLVVSDFYPLTGPTARSVDGSPTSIALLAGGTALVTPTGADDQNASIIDLSSDRVLAQVPLGDTAYSAVTAPDSHTVYLGTTHGRVLVFDAASSSVTDTIGLELAHSRLNHLALNSAGTLLYASSFTSGAISEIDLAQQKEARIFIVGGEPQGLALTPDGSELYVANEAGNGHIDIYNVVTNVHEASIPSGASTSVGGAFGLAISPDGSKVYVGVTSNEGPGLIQLLDTGTRTITRTFNSCGSTPRRIAFGYSGGLAVIADESGCATFVE